MEEVVFYDTGGGDIYAGKSRESVLRAMIRDGGTEFNFDEEMFEVSGSTPMRTEDGEVLTLTREYHRLGFRSQASYCIASENC